MRPVEPFLERPQRLEVSLQLGEARHQMADLLDGSRDLARRRRAARRGVGTGPGVEGPETAIQILRLPQQIARHGACAYDVATAAASPPNRSMKYSQVRRMPVAKSTVGR